MHAEVWSVLAVVAFWIWIATSLLFIFKAFPRFGVFQSRPALVWGIASMLSACLWVLALRQA
jgi:hypothetical protein